MIKPVLILFIICSILAAFSGCTSTEQAPVTEKSGIQAEFQPTIESAVLLGREHAKTMEAIQEAFAYIVSGSVEEKNDFVSLMEQVEYLDSEFIRVADFDETEVGKDFSDKHSVVMDARKVMISSAESMFEEYAEKGYVTPESHILILANSRLFCGRLNIKGDDGPPLYLLKKRGF